MTQDGDADDLWAATRPDGTPPPTPPPPPDDAGWEFLGETSDPTTTMAGVGAAGTGGPPPPAPPGDEPPGGTSGRPPWLIPAVIVLGVILLGALTLVLLFGGGDEDVATPTATSTTTTLPATSTTSTTTTTVPPTTTSTTTTTVAPTTSTTSTTTTSTTSTTTTTTLPPSPLPDPGFAIVGPETVPIDRSCRTIPLQPNYGHYQLSSQIVRTASGRLVLDRWYDEGGVDGLDLWNVETDSRLVAAAVQDVGSGYVATVEVGGDTITVAVNPVPEEPGDCFETVVTSETDLEMWPHTQAVLDLCSTGGGPAHDLVAILTEGSRLTISDDGGGGARVVYEPPFGDDPFTADEATSADEDVFRVYEAALARSPDTLYLRAILGVPAQRTCDAAEFPT